MALSRWVAVSAAGLSADAAAAGASLALSGSDAVVDCGRALDAALAARVDAVVAREGAVDMFGGWSGEVR